MRQGLDETSGAPLGTRQPPRTLRVPPFLDRPSLRHSHPVDGRTVPCPYFGLLTPVSASPCLPPEPARRVPRSPRFSEENTEEQGAQETCGVLPWEAVRPELVRAAGRGSRAGLVPRGLEHTGGWAAHRTTPGDRPLPPVAGHFLGGCWGPRLRAESSHTTRATWGGSLHLAELILIKDKNAQSMCV